MTKYASYEKGRVERPWKVHPVWRGIGCILIILVPLLAYSGATLLKDANLKNGWISTPPELDKYIDMTRVEKLIPGLSPIWEIVEKIYMLDLVLTGMLTILGFGLLTVFNGLLYGMLAPSRYGPLDSPEVRHSPPKRVRHR